MKTQPRRRSKAWLRFALAASATAGLVLACSGVAEHPIGIVAPSESEDQFGLLANYLDHRCGSLDCHGQVGRNLRIWGCEGMRLDDADIPSCTVSLGGRPTTVAEHQATYRSLVGLEPTVMSLVVEDHGQDPERLTFIRKARGIEPHAGGALIVPGDVQDVCITSWLAGSTNVAACASAFTFPAYPMPDASTD
jgi:hypothetical protein